MNKDDSDFFRYVKKEPSSSSNIALDLINGLENRNYGNIKKNVKSKENIEVFAEEQFIRKKDFEEMRCEMPGQPRSTFLMVFSPDGSRVASTHGNHNIYITDILTGKHIRTLVGHPRTPWCIAFHPTSDQIVASGCLGGQVRIWDLSGGSEVWTAVNQTVIASLAFHPTDRVLVIATYNEIYFWDWSQPEPFVHVATSNPKEKVRFVAFDSLGHKLITGIANSPQTRWERVRAPVPVPRQERSVSPYRRRITQRLQSQNISSPSQDSNTSNRESLSNVPARVRRITICYRNLVREYEQLVQRYLQLYRPPTMIDRGTDPMEPNESQSTSSENPGPSTSRSLNSNNESNSEPQPGPSTQVEPGPSSSQDNNTASSSSHLLAPSRIFSLAPVNKPTVLIRGTQTSESRKHKTNHDQTEPKGKRIKVSSNNAADNETVPENNAGTQENSTNNVQNESESASPFNSMLEDWRRGMARNNSNSNRNPNASSTSRFRINPSLYVDVVPPSTVNSDRRTSTELNDSHDNLTNDDRRQYSTNVDELLHNIRRTAEEEVRNRILPIIRSVPINDRPELIRLFENSREHVRMRFRQMYPTFVKKQTRRDRRNVNVVDTTSDSSSSDEDNSTSTTVDPRRSNDQSSSSLNNQNNTLPGNTTNTSASNTNPPSSSSTVRNFNTELEQLVTSLLTEIETDRTSSTSNSNLNTETTRQSQIANSTPQDSAIPVPREDASSIADQTETSSPSNRTMPFFQRFLQRRNTSVEDIPPPLSIRTPAFEPFPSDTDNGRASSPIFMNFIPRRRRFFSHRISAFMPTRVNYNRNSRLRRPTHTVGRGRLGLRNQNVSSLDVDELINYSERENSEEDTPQPLDLSNHTTPENGSVNNMYSNIRLGNVYSNIIHDLESSLSDVIRMRASNRPGETSDMLGSFSERLENIMQQSDTILRNLSHSMEMLSSSTEPNTHRTQSTEPSWSFFDQNFYVRDQRTENVSQDSSNREEVFNLSDIFNSRPPFINSATSDHTYPRIPENAHSSSQNEGISPLMTSIHMTISHIQRQARLLRRQVESIERIDRAMLEVAQLQLIRQLIIELVRHVRTLSGENRSTGMTSVRQMMAGTRISDSSPYESPSEDVTPQENNQTNTSSNTLNTEQSTSSNGPTRARSSHRKTYPPGRLFRFGRQSRRPSIINFFSRRYTRSERNPRTNPFSRLSAHEPCPNYTYINTYTLSSMTRRLQHLLIEQVQNLTPPPAQQHPQQERTNSRSTVDLGEHMLASRLHACLLRVNRLIGNNINVDPVENLYVGQPAAAVTQDGESRYRARHCLTMIIECMSRHIEELGNSSIQTNMRQQFHGVLVMSLLLTELLLLVIVDSIPPPTGINLIPERASLTSRIDHMVTQLLQSRFSHSHQLTRSLRLMKLTMRHAHTALGQTYQSRRNEMLPRINTNRQQVLGSINRCLRFINRQREQRETPPMDPNITSTNNLLEEPTSSNGNPNSQNPSTSNQDNANNSIEWYSNIYDFFIRRYSNNRDEDTDNRPSTSGRDRVVPQNDPSSTNDNTDGDDDETDGYNNNYIPHSTNSYRTNNVNVAGGSGQPPRIWNVPAVQVNDVPVSEPSTLTQRVINQRQRFAERVSELRSNPSVGLFRPRFLHPLYASVMNPFDADLDDPQREPLYDGDMITTVTPNHRIQAWDVSDWTVPMPEISDALKNVVVSECKIHNDASVDVAKDGTILVTLLPSGGYLNVTNKLGVYSLKWETLGQCLYITCFEQNAVSVSLSPLSRHLIVGLTHRIITNDRWVMARIFKIDQKDVPGDRLPVLRELEQSRDSRINCIRWLPISGQGLIYATNTGQLVVLS